MQTTEIRVRPVIRHAVTRYTSGQTPDGGNYGGCESLGEFANERYAEEVAQAITWKSRPRQFVIVQRNFDLKAEAIYADYRAVAEQIKKDREGATELEYRIFERELTDPVAIARLGLQTEEMALADYIRARDASSVADHCSNPAQRS